jgi:hypothetical protein
MTTWTGFDRASSSVAMPAKVAEALSAHLNREDGQEDLCFVLWRPSLGRARASALVVDIVLPLSNERHVHGNVSFESEYFMRSAAIASERGCGLGLIHSHPGARGWQGLSADDFAAESGHAAQAEVLTGLPLLGLTIATQSECCSARLWKRVDRGRYKPRWCESVRETAAGVAKTKAWKTFSPSVGNLDAEDFFGVPGPFDFLMWSPWDSSGAMSDALLRVRPDLPADLMKDVLKAAAQGDPDGVLVTDKKGRPQPDPDLRDNENVPLPDVAVNWETDVTERLKTPAYRAAVDEYVTAEVLPYVADAWVDYDKTKIGYEVPLTRHFYRYVLPRPLAVIDAEIKALEDEIRALLQEVVE